MSAQKPLELILARNLLSSISTPAFLVSENGDLLFYNEAAGALLGRSFEETGAMAPQAWTSAFGPFDADEQRDVVRRDPRDGGAARESPLPRPIPDQRRRRQSQDIEASAIPIVGSGGQSGAMVFFWPVTDEYESERTLRAGEESERA